MCCLDFNNNNNNRANIEVIVIADQAHCDEAKENEINFISSNMIQSFKKDKKIIKKYCMSFNNLNSIFYSKLN
jgi:ribosomal protein L1